MMIEKYEDGSELQRDHRGRFCKGVSGNPNGRPRKVSAPPWTLQSSVSSVLEQVVSVTGPDGKPRELALRDAYIERLLRSAITTKPRDAMFILERLVRLGAFQPVEDAVVDEPMFTEEDRRLVEIVGMEFSELIRTSHERPAKR